MIGLLFLAAGAFALVMALAVAWLAFRIAVRLLPVVAGIAAAAIAASTGADAGNVLAIAIAAAVLVALTQRRDRRARRAARSRPLPRVRPRPMPEPVGFVPRSPEDARLAATFHRAQAVAPEHRARLAQAQVAAAGLLREAAASPFDIELVDAAQMLLRRGPDLVDSAEALCALSTAADCRACGAELVAGLEELAGVTGELGAYRRGRLRDAFATVRRHIASRRGPATP